MRIAIIDDSTEDTSVLLKQLHLFFKPYSFLPSIDIFHSPKVFLEQFERDLYDLCFLDLLMPEMNGFETAQAIRGKDKVCRLIFLSSSTDYLIDGYRVGVLRYILKPITLEQLKEVLPECVNDITSTTKRLEVQIDRTSYQIPFAKIYSVQSSIRTEIHLEEQCYSLPVRTTFTETTKPLLEDYRFLTCNRGIVINMEHVKKVSKEGIFMDNGDLIPVSRRLYQSVVEQIMNFQFEHMR